MYRVAQQVMRGEHAWLETGIIDMVEPEAADTAPASVARQREVAAAP